MFSVVLTALVYLLDESLLHVLLKILDVKVLVLSIEIVQKLSFVFYISVDPQERWDLLWHDMDKIFTWQILHECVASFNSVLRKIIKNASFLLNSPCFLIAVVVSVHQVDVVVFFLVLQELVHIGCSFTTDSVYQHQKEINLMLESYLLLRPFKYWSDIFISYLKK